MGATLGCIPQCGFSAVMADMFNHKLIGIGTLIAVFVSTSDEAIPIMLSYPDKILQILFLLLIKFLVALFFGYLFYFLFLWLGKIKNKKELQKQGATITTEEYLHNHECKIDDETTSIENYYVKIDGKKYESYAIYYPVGNGRFNQDKAIEDIKMILSSEDI